MAEIVNLRQARKRQALTQKRQTAEQNRALHGRSKEQKSRDETEAGKAARFLDAHRREAAGSGDDDA